MNIFYIDSSRITRTYQKHSPEAHFTERFISKKQNVFARTEEISIASHIFSRFQPSSPYLFIYAFLRSLVILIAQAFLHTAGIVFRHFFVFCQRQIFISRREAISLLICFCIYTAEYFLQRSLPTTTGQIAGFHAFDFSTAFRQPRV